MPSYDVIYAVVDSNVQTSALEQYGPVVGGAIAISGGAWAVVKFLFARIEQSHQLHLKHADDAIRREQERADRADARADKYEQELKESVKVWFEQVSPAMTAAARAIDAVTGQLRITNDERRHS